MLLVDKTEQIIRRPTPSDINTLIENIREEDIKEITELDGMSVRDALDDTPDMDKNAWVWEKDGKIMCIFGINPVENSTVPTGVIWMLATKDFGNNEMIFGHACRPVFEDIMKNFRYVFNYVYAENIRSIKWLKWLGFTVKEAEPIGINGAKFHCFEMWNEKCVNQQQQH